jgi:hypothetical protein
MIPRKLLLLAALAAAAACSARAGNNARDTESASDPAQSTAPQGDALASRGIAASPASDTAGGGPAAPAAPMSAGMLIRTGTAQVEVDSLDRAVARVRALAAQVGGYVGASTVQGGREQAREAELELKIPAARWDQALSALAPIGRVESVNVKSDDVGEEFVDVQARMANARRLEDRLLQLLAARTGKLDEVLQVEHELARVREEIERYEGRLRYLSSRAAVSTLTVTLHEPRPVVGDYPGSSVLGRAFLEAWRNFIGFLAGFISALGILVPLAVLLGGIWWAARRLRARRPARAEPPSPARHDKPHLEE